MVHHSPDATAIGAQRTPRTAPTAADTSPELGGAVRGVRWAPIAVASELWWTMPLFAV